MVGVNRGASVYEPTMLTLFTPTGISKACHAYTRYSVEAADAEPNSCTWCSITYKW